MSPNIAHVVRFLHCKACVTEARHRRRAPQKYAKLSIGITTEGNFLVACDRHGTTIVEFPAPGFLLEMTGRPCALCDEAKEESRQ